MKMKTKLFNLKIKPEVHLDFKVAAEMRGSTMSSLLHQFIVQAIREEKKQHSETEWPKSSNSVKVFWKNCLERPRKSSGNYWKALAGGYI